MKQNVPVNAIPFYIIAFLLSYEDFDVTACKMDMDESKSLLKVNIRCTYEVCTQTCSWGPVHHCYEPAEAIQQCMVLPSYVGVLKETNKETNSVKLN